MAEPTFTGLSRRRKTPRSVRTAETAARTFITLGGIGTIVAVVLIFVFLLWVVVPLFRAAEVHPRQPVGFATPSADKPIIAAGIDPDQRMAWSLRSDGRLVVQQLVDGTRIVERLLFGGSAPTCWAFSPDGADCAFGFADGTIRQGRFEFKNEFLPTGEAPEAVRALRPGGAVRHEHGVITLTPARQLRYDHLHVEVQDPVKASDSSIDLIDYSATPGGAALAFLTGDDQLSISSVERIHDIWTDTYKSELVKKPLVYEPPAGRPKPSFLKLSGIANTLFLAWQDGFCLRFDARSSVLAAGGKFEVVEELWLLGEPDRRADRVVERIGSLVGKSTLVVADQHGTLSCWFPTRPRGAYPRDGVIMAEGHVLPPGDGDAHAVTCLAPSKRSRLLAVGYADGGVRLYHVTTEQELVSVKTERREPILGLALAPKEDGLVAWSSAGFQHWVVDPGHPEATWHSLFGKVWYEGNVGPEHDWEAEGGSDDFEPKLGIYKLVYGTIKATIYSMLIAAPIALLAAIFTSEFLTPRFRAPIKSVIEMMASLPSVVLGFLAAIVLAPYVENVLIAVLCGLITLPLALVIGARLWQFLPTGAAVRLGGLPRFVAVAAMLPVAVVLARWLAPQVEAACFAGDVTEYLNGNRGEASGGWIFFLAPLSIVLVGIGVARIFGPWLRRVSIGWSRLQCAMADLLRLALVLGGGVLIAWALGSALGAAADARGTLVGKYEPRNAMIVGFVMGFAIVPIIYTLAEDALSSVPGSLREGSLGAGATQWQTAWRIVVPTAMSGLFSALMIGLGRAVGETMIVLMAAGNTAISDPNPFNGFRTLSANIAVELPEAVQGSTHYRILFLTGLVLFAMTFVINTAAEMVRRRFRKRFADL